MNGCFHKMGENFLLYEEVSFLRPLLYITQSINTYIGPVCPDRLILRYCSCKTYLLHRRAELKAAPRSTCLMRNWMLGNNQPLAVSNYTRAFWAISCFVLNNGKNLPLFVASDCVVIRILSMSVFTQFTINQLSCSDCLNESKLSYCA